MQESQRLETDHIKLMHQKIMSNIWSMQHSQM